MKIKNRIIALFSHFICPLLTVFLHCAPVLDEASERRESGAGSDHDDGHSGFERQAELGLAHVDWHPGKIVARWSLAGEPRRRHTFLRAIRQRLPLDQHSGDTDNVRVVLETKKKIKNKIK